jgi:hypothetical protein
VVVPPESVAIPQLVAPAVACPLPTDAFGNRPLRMPSAGIGRFESNPVIAAFAADLARCYVARKGGQASAGEDALAADYAATLTAGLVRYGSGWRKSAERRVQLRARAAGSGRAGFSAADQGAIEKVRCAQEVWLAERMNWLRTGWMMGRREQVDFDTLMPASLRALPRFGAPALAAGARPGLVPIEPEGTGSPLTPEAKAFLVALRRRATAFDANNYPGHGGGSFAGRGLSIDLSLREPVDRRGFYPRDQAVAFLLHVDAAAGAAGLRWRVLYNDFAVAQHINKLKGALHVRFIGKPAGNLNWHGPLVLHFHLDLAP